MQECKYILENMFPNGIPKFSEWTDMSEIQNILNKLGSYDTLMFCPPHGTLPFKGASSSNEENCIEIETAGSEIISPKSLTFHSFDNLDWSYFRIELNEISQTKVYNEKMDFREELCELSPLNYVSLTYYFDDSYLPKDARIVQRRLKGILVIFYKYSPYNNGRTVDGRHNNYTDSEFKNYIDEVISNGF